MISTLLDRNPVASTPAQRLRLTTAAVRVALKWLGVRKTLTPEQRSQAAEAFRAEGDFISARKKLLDTSHAAYKEVTAARGHIIRFWKGVTLPYPEPGIRLLRQDQVETFDGQMGMFREQLHAAVAQLEGHYAELKSVARARLGQLYNAHDYPTDLRGLFDVAWDFPAVEPPSYLLELSPALYEQEKARVAARFEEAVTLAEQTFIEEFGKLVAHLTERLSGGFDGEPKVFRDSAVTNLLEFFNRFRDLNVRSNAQLDEWVEQVRRVVRGVEPQALRDSASLRQQIAGQLSQVQSAIDGMMTDLPRRRIIRSHPFPNGAGHDPAH